MDSLIDHIVGGDKVEQSKPSPEGLEFAIKQSGIKKKDTLYIGDSPSDGKTSINAGVRFIAVLTGVTGLKKLEAYQPIEILNSLELLPAIVQKLDCGV